MYLRALGGYTPHQNVYSEISLDNTISDYFSFLIVQMHLKFLQ